MTKEQTPKGRTLKFDVGKEYSGSDFLKLLMISHKHSRLALEYISDFFDIGHSEVNKNISEKS